MARSRSLHGLRRPEVSPAILAARLTVDDTARIDSVIAALRGESDVAYVEREQWITIHNGARRERAVTSAALGKTSGWETPSSVPTRSGVNTLIPRDIYYPYEMWAANMVDLPKAWALTTGSANVTVAVLDMGVRFEHPSLAGNLTERRLRFRLRVRLRFHERELRRRDAVPVHDDGGRR